MTIETLVIAKEPTATVAKRLEGILVTERCGNDEFLDAVIVEEVVEG